MYATVIYVLVCIIAQLHVICNVLDQHNLQVLLVQYAPVKCIMCITEFTSTSTSTKYHLNVQK